MAPTPTENDLSQAWEDSGHDPALYRGLLIERGFHAAYRTPAEGVVDDLGPGVAADTGLAPIVPPA